MTLEQTTTEGGQGNTGTTEGGQATTWLDSLPDDLKGNESLKAYETPEAMAKAHLETLGKLPLVPENADAYQIEIPDGHPANADFVKSAKAWAYESGLSQEQFKQFAVKYIEAEAAMIKEHQISEEKALNDLKKEQGSQFDAFVQTAQKAVERFATPDEKKWLDQTGLGSNSTFVRMFGRIGAAISEDKLITGQSGGTQDIKRDVHGQPMVDQKGYPEMQKR